MPTVYYETPGGIEIETPDDVHTDADPLLTMVWYDEGADHRVVQVPIRRVFRIEGGDA